ncbi:helix-turn-helix domain-containing protein [Streptomyces acidiscabies]|uniref:helix-turn-helix domain-containing protein n=1 Tax=Streptomyces acidiscabies TaxID=42234 RepID=UPI00073EA6F8|nr:XRE family transcriptional regulator [Streptomyces acidiscabies]
MTTDPRPADPQEADLHEHTAVLPDREVDPGAAAQALGLEAVIGRQVREYRTAAGLSIAEMAARVGLSKAMLSKIENAQTSCSLTTLGRLANGLGIPVTALFRGLDADREAVYVPAGHGARIVRRGSRVGHLYELLGALRGPHKRMEAVLVTLTEQSEVFPLFQHPGTELLYMLEGEMVYGHGESAYTLRPGDALQLDGEGPHGPQELVTLPIRFLSVTAFGDHHPQ